MKVTISFNASVAQIEGTVNPQHLWIINKSLSYVDKSAEFIKSNRKGASYYIGDTSIYLFNIKAQTFPTGLIGRVVMILEQNGYEVEYRNLIPEVTPHPAIYPETTRQYQIDSINKALEYRRGLLVLPTGTGKTFLAALFISHFPHCKVLFITCSNKSLMYQNAKELEEILGEEIGILGDGKQKWRRVTVGVINTVENIAKKDPDLLKDIQVAIFDEAHTSAGSNRGQTVSNELINTDYRIGLTATNWRESGDEIRLEGIIGPTIHQMSYIEASDNNYIIKPELYTVEVPDPNIVYPSAKKERGKLFYDTPNGKPPEDEVYVHALINNSYRNNLITQAAKIFLESEFEFPGAILLQDIKNGHGDELQKLLNIEGYDIPFIHGKTKLKDRETIYKALDNKELKLIICSVGIISVGINIRPLSVFINAGGGGSTINSVQTNGRFARTSAGKDRSINIDFKDLEQFYLKRQFFKRIEIIEKLYQVKHQVIKIDALEQVFKPVLIKSVAVEV
jgi:superfamily II DNA or RNA helicase